MNLVPHTTDISLQAIESITANQLPRDQVFVLAAYLFTAKKGSFICNSRQSQVVTTYNSLCKQYGHKAKPLSTFQRNRDKLEAIGLITMAVKRTGVKTFTTVTVSIEKFSELFKRAFRKAMTKTKHRYRYFLKSQDDLKKQEMADKRVSLEVARAKSLKAPKKNDLCSSSNKAKQVKRSINFVENLAEIKHKIFNCVANIDEVKKVVHLYREKGWVWNFNQYCTRTGRLITNLSGLNQYDFDVINGTDYEDIQEINAAFAEQRAI